MSAKIDAARELSRSILDAALNAFPDCATVNFYDLSGDMRAPAGQELTPRAEMARHLTDWLAREGYLHLARKTERGGPAAAIQITAKGLALLQIDLFGP